MALKDFTDLYKLDISAEIKKKPTFKKADGGKLEKLPEKYWLDYLEWATVLTLLYANGASKVRFGTSKNTDGYPAFYNSGKNPFVSVWVEIDGDRFELDYPVIDGNKSEENPTQIKIHSAQQRAFVKCVAINTGLGLKLWQKEESNFDNIESHTQKPPFPDSVEHFNQTVKWLKAGNDLSRLEEKYFIDDLTKTKLIIASE